MFEKVKEIIEEKLNVEGMEITEESRFKEDLNADSLDLFELVMALEDEFGVEISINVPGKSYPTSLTISSDYTPRVDPKQVEDQWLFETKAEMDRYFKDKGW